MAQLSCRHCDPSHKRRPNQTFRDGHHRVQASRVSHSSSIRRTERVSRPLQLIGCGTTSWKGVTGGLVASLNRPGGNATGISWFNAETAAKRLGLLHELVPGASMVALLVNPSDPDAGTQLVDVQEAASVLGRPVVLLNAATADEIDAAFAVLVKQQAAALVVTTNPFYLNRRDQIIALAARHAVPAIYTSREFITAGGLISYGNNLLDAYRRNGIYTGRILKGDKPGDLPVDRSTKFELVINLETAKALGLDLPLSLQIRADEVIE